MSYITQPMQASHRDAVLRLWQENLPELGDRQNLEDRSARAYHKKPDGAARTIVVVHEESGELVGCGSAYPRSVALNGSRLLAGVLADFAVARAHRSGAAAIMIQRALIDGGGAEPAFAFLYGLPNMPALPIFKRAGYRTIGPVQSWVKPLRAAYKLREYVRGGSIARFAAFPVDSYLAAADARRARRFPPAQSEIVGRADQRFDDLWQRARRSYALAGERTASYLNWRYTAPTSTKHEFFCLREQGRADLLGYVVFSREEKRVVVYDLFAMDLADAAERLLVRFTSEMRREGCDSVFVAYFGDSRLAQCLSRTGFVSRGQERSVMLMTRTITHEHARAINFQNTWCLFSGEMDV